MARRTIYQTTVSNAVLGRTQVVRGERSKPNGLRRKHGCASDKR